MIKGISFAFLKSFSRNIHEIVIKTKGHPVQKSLSSQIIKWEVPTVTANVTAFARGLTPLLIPNNYTHKLPLKTIDLADARGNERVNTVKVNTEKVFY